MIYKDKTLFKQLILRYCSILYCTLAAFLDFTELNVNHLFIFETRFLIMGSIAWKQLKVLPPTSPYSIPPLPSFTSRERQLNNFRSFVKLQAADNFTLKSTTTARPTPYCLAYMSSINNSRTTPRRPTTSTFTSMLRYLFGHNQHQNVVLNQINNILKRFKIGIFW